jgi:predicted DNA binding protein
MNLWEVSFRTQYEYPFIEMSQRHPDTPMSLWCIWNRELLQVPTSSRLVLTAVEGLLKEGGFLIEKWGDVAGGRTYFLRDTCDRWNSVWNIVEPNSAMIAPPLVFSGGWCYGRMLAFEESTTRAVFKALGNEGKAELLSKRELPYAVLPSTVWVYSLFAELTLKQKEAVLSAHHHGYYRTPRKVGTEDVSKASGVSRSTFEEHLRKAENRIMDAVMPYLQLYARASPKDEDLISPGTPTGPVRADT